MQMVDKWESKQGMFEDIHILLQNRVKCLNVASGKLTEPRKAGSVKGVFMVERQTPATNGAGSSEGPLPSTAPAAASSAAGLGEDWTMTHVEGGAPSASTDVGRQGVATAKELDRIKKEKEELMKRMQALTIRETTLETQAATIPELYGELANRRRTERSLRTAGAPTVLGPSASDPVSTLWQTMADTHSPTNRRGSAVPSTSASSAASATVEASDGTLYAPAVPGKKDDAEKTRLRREMYDRQSDDRGNFKAGACAKYDSTKMLEQTRCRHPFDQLKWGANGKSIYASCGACGLKTCVMYNRSEAFVSDVEDDVNDVHVVQLAPGLVMMDTGCRAAVGGTSWHKNLQKCLKGLGRTFYQKEQLEYFQFGPGEPITSTRRWHYQVGVQGQNRELSISASDDRTTPIIYARSGHPCLSLLEYDKNPRAVSIGIGAGDVRRGRAVRPLFGQ
jgi:hypothetical protein